MNNLAISIGRYPRSDLRIPSFSCGSDGPMTSGVDRVDDLHPAHFRGRSNSRVSRSCGANSIWESRPLDFTESSRSLPSLECIELGAGALRRTRDRAGIFRPILGPDSVSSVDLIKRLMNAMPGAPRIYFGVVDVRDVADLQLRAMTHPASKSERFIAVSGNAISMVDIARILRAWPDANYATSTPKGRPASSEL